MSSQPMRSTLDGLPKQFVASMRTLFDIMDENSTGLIRFGDIETRWREDDLGTAASTTATRKLPKGVIECLRKVTPANGDIGMLHADEVTTTQLSRKGHPRRREPRRHTLANGIDYNMVMAWHRLKHSDKMALLLSFMVWSLYCTLFTVLNRDRRAPGRKSVPTLTTAGTIPTGDVVDFTGADNVTGFSRPIVPNIVHLIKFRSRSLSFVELINIRSVQENHRPDRILMHCSECANDKLEGKYWDMLKGHRPAVEVVHLDEPTQVFGHNLSSVHHASDVARIRILMRYGGIFLDGDVYVVQSLDRFRRFEMALGWDEDQYIGTQVLVAHKNARFLPLWLDGYRSYEPNLWYYNAGEWPTDHVLRDAPHLVHRVKVLFGVHVLTNELYKSSWPEWRTYYTIHLLINHRWYLDEESPIEEFDEDNIRDYKFTYGEMARLLFYSTGSYVPP